MAAGQRAELFINEHTVPSQSIEHVVYRSCYIVTVLSHPPTISVTKQFWGIFADFIRNEALRNVCLLETLQNTLSVIGFGLRGKPLKSVRFLKAGENMFTSNHTK